MIKQPCPVCESTGIVGHLSATYAPACGYVKGLYGVKQVAAIVDAECSHCRGSGVVSVKRFRELTESRP